MMVDISYILLMVIIILYAIRQWQRGAREYNAT